MLPRYSEEEMHEKIESLLICCSRYKVLGQKKYGLICNLLTDFRELYLRDQTYSTKNKIKLITKMDEYYDRLFNSNSRDDFVDNVGFMLNYLLYREEKIKLDLDSVTDVYECYKKNISKFSLPHKYSSTVWCLRTNFLNFCSNNLLGNPIKDGERYLNEYNCQGEQVITENEAALIRKFLARIKTTIAIEYGKIFKLQEELRYLREAVEDDPSYAPVYSCMAHMFVDLGYQEKAEKLFEIARNLNSARYNKRHPSPDELAARQYQAKIAYNKFRIYFSELQVEINLIEKFSQSIEEQAYIKKQELGQKVSTEADIIPPRKVFSWIDSMEELSDAECDSECDSDQEIFNEQFPLYEKQTLVPLKQIQFEEYSKKLLETVNELDSVNDDLNVCIVEAEKYGQKDFAKRVENRREEWMQVAEKNEEKIKLKIEAEKTKREAEEAKRKAEEKARRAERVAASRLNANSSVFFPGAASQPVVTRFSASSAEFIPSSSGSTVSRELNANNTPDVVSRFGAGGK